MKIKNQSLMMTLFSLLVILTVSRVSLEQTKKTDNLTHKLQRNEAGVTLLHEFQVAAMAQVLYGIDLIRTEDISGDRITAYRMAETQFNREIEKLSSLNELGDEIEKDVQSLILKGMSLSNLCKKEMLTPLYSHIPLDEGIIERLIYKELINLNIKINDIRNKLNKQIQISAAEQKVQKEVYIKRWMPVAGISLFCLLLGNFIIIRLILHNINKTGILLGTLAEGQGKLDSSISVSGNNEISVLRNNFNRFMENLSSRHKCLLLIAEDQVSSGIKLNNTSLEHSAAVKQLNESLTMVNGYTRIMEDKVQSTLNEVHTITETLDSLSNMSVIQDEQVNTMATRSSSVSDSLNNQKSAVEEQVLLTEKVKEESYENRRIMKFLRQQINEIMNQSEEIAAAIYLIKDLADQTDVLAINASIEAAHAGIYGKGFAVVADEMRKLSNQVRGNSTLVTDLLGELNEKLLWMSNEEKQSQKAMERLILQNRNAENAVHGLKKSNGEIQTLIKDFFKLLTDVSMGSTQILTVSENLRASSKHISSHMEELKEKQNTLGRETEEMAQGVSQLFKGTEIMGNLSRKNEQNASELNKEIYKLGS